MFLVKLDRSCDKRYQPLTIKASEYLYDFAAFIARSVPDAEVHARLGHEVGDEVVFHGTAVDDGDIELF
ncbi:MAG TPA: hypothetical protein VL974_00565 [Magnetospirillum sp.]|jgi:hypothetical protein|nr:hypothetical protein [Magnetospirillum sp.]